MKILNPQVTDTQANWLLSACDITYDHRRNEIAIHHPALGTLFVLNMDHTPVQRAFAGWAQQEANAMLVMAYAVERWPDHV